MGVMVAMIERVCSTVPFVRTGNSEDQLKKTVVKDQTTKGLCWNVEN